MEELEVHLSFMFVKLQAMGVLELVLNRSDKRDTNAIFKKYIYI